MEDCIFCKIVRGDIPCHKIYEDQKVLAFADINPIAEGHTLVIPKRHAADLWEIREDDLAAIHMASRKIAQAMKKALKPLGVACLQLNGKGVNQVVLHYHLPELPMTRWELKPGDPEAIKQTVQKIREKLE
jgi:histidine triad (HIT) family protein